MKTLRNLVLTASVAMLAACASTTPYKEASKPGGFDGYSQTLLDNNTARVSFGGNSLTDRETVENYLLYRAAEIALERGFETFSLVDQDTEKDTRVTYRTTGGPRGGFGNGFSSDPFFRYSFFNSSLGWSPFNRFSRFSRFNRFDRFGNFRGSRFGSSRFGDPRFGGSRFGGPGFGSSAFGGGRVTARENTKYRATAQVAFGQTAAPGSDHMFNARQIIDNLGPTIVFPEEKG